VTKIKLWISDIDGTLMNYDGSMTKRMRALIKRINESDVKLVLATGRMFMGANHEAKKFNLKTPVVCYQGAVVRTENEILWQSPIKNELLNEIIDYLENKNIHTHIYFNDKLYINDDNKRIMNEYCNNRGTNYIVVNDFKKLNLKNIPKILGVIEDNNLMQEVKKELSQKYQGILTIVQSSSKYLEITDLHASKGDALNFLKTYWNLKEDEIIASGDQDNDIEMLKQAGIKISVGQNSKEIQKYAQYHCKSVDSDELVDFIEEFVFCE